MRYLKLSLIMLVFFTVFSSHITALTEYIISVNVLSNGGTVQTNSSLQLSGTLGQSIIGIMSCSSHINCVGFWHQCKDSCEPILVKENPLPMEIKLLGNFPNPFNPSTEIRYEVPNQCHVKISIYSLSGQLVTSILDETVSAGLHAVRWNPKGAATGVYIYSLETGETGEKRLMNKMLLLK